MSIFMPFKNWFVFGVKIGLLLSCPHSCVVSENTNIPANYFNTRSAERNIVIDSALNFDEAIKGTNAPAEIINNLVLLTVDYIGFDSLTHSGQIVVNKEVASDVTEIFKELLKSRFPIEKVKPIVLYDWSDSLSMRDNNTSAFNYRLAVGSRRLSKHATGKAIDINPRVNPYFKDETMLPVNGIYDTKQQGTITDTSSIVELFEQRGWIWGGRWISIKDYQHFEKNSMDQM